MHGTLKRPPAPEPQPTPDVRAVATLLSRYTVCARVMAALPEHDAPPLSPKQIFVLVDLGSPYTVKHVLRAMARSGIAQHSPGPKMGGLAMRLYRKTERARDLFAQAERIAADPDNFEDSPNVYDEGRTERSGSTERRPEMTKHVEMLIGDAEIRARFPEESDAIIAALDMDPNTRAYQPVFNGKRFRPAVEKALASFAANER